METFRPYLEKIKSIAWTLSLASGKQCLDVPGEYIWAYPGSINKKNIDFNDVRQRFKSIFSSGNSIKDPKLINFIQNCQLNKFLLDPWTVKVYEERWVEWLKESNKQTYNLKNLELFKNLCYSQGTQESFLNFYMMNRHKRFRIFAGEYWWHMDIWSKLKYDWEYIEKDDIKENDVCIVSYPFALYGKKHEKFDWLVEQCEKVGTEILVDFIYFNYMVKKYQNLQLEWCKKLNLQPTDVVHFAIGEDYYKKEEIEENFCSPFNVQTNRYNLGMLYENNKLLQNLGF